MNYTSKQWKLLREKILKRDKYMCQYFKRYGKRIDATMVHHIFPADEYPQWAYKEWNLISLSNEAHEKMHDRISHELTAEGIALQNRLIRLGKIPKS